MREVGVYLCGKIQEAVRMAFCPSLIQIDLCPYHCNFLLRGTASTELKVDGIVLFFFSAKVKSPVVSHFVTPWL